jgi:hypothetical protein
MPFSDLPITYEFVCLDAGVQKIARGPVAGCTPQGLRMLKAPRQIAWLGIFTKPTSMQRGG